jgi:hypothetical protein
MKIITDHKFIKRNKRIGQITTFISMALLGVGLYLTFTQVYITWSFAALLGGFLLSQIGIYYGSRWGRSPRPDEVLNQALKGLDHKYTIYHYCTPVPHLLVGPAGIWNLAHYAQRGTITYDEQKNRWIQKGGNLYLKIFAQEGLGRPDLEVAGFERSLEKYLKKKFDETQIPQTGTVLVFSNEKAVVQVENALHPTVHVKKLKDFIRRQAKVSPASTSVIEKVEEAMPGEFQE